ncbi:unnamed protein product [Arabidopsis arenosa]|uniref:Uncharacterized protein n=1 Tax=Arabidopsis arenosa TaxID=38785 RepID=A0A8S2A7J9_ARAAE|nr:unnamed protein product [Arabidopsis arenosa]
MVEVQKLGSLSNSDLFPGGLGWCVDFVSRRNKQLDKAFVEVDTMLNHIVDDHLKNPIEETTHDRPDIIDSLLDMIHKQEQGASFKLTIDHLKGILQRLDENKLVNKEKIEELMFEFQKVGSLSSSDLFPAGVGWFMDFVSGRHKTLHKVFVEVDTLLNHVIDGHLKNPEEKTNQDRPDIIDSILDTMYKQEQDGSFKLTIDHLKGIIQRLDENKHVNKEKIEELMFEVQKVGSLSSSDLFPAGVGWFMDFVSGRHKTLHKVFVEVDTLLNHVIDGHLKNPEEKTNQDRPDIIDSILDTMYKQEQDGSFKLTIDHLKGIIQVSIKSRSQFCQNSWASISKVSYLL